MLSGSRKPEEKLIGMIKIGCEDHKTKQKRCDLQVNITLSGPNDFYLKLGLRIVPQKFVFPATKLVVAS